MAFKINADRYAYSAEPEKISGSYTAELAKKLIADEAEARQSEDAALKNEIEIAVAEERGIRTEADRALDERISLEASRRVAGDEALDGRLSDEISARLAQERSLQGRISEEVQARTTADADIRADIAAESERISGRLDESEALINSLAAGKADKSHTHKSTDIVYLLEDGGVDCTLQDQLDIINSNIGGLYGQKADKDAVEDLSEQLEETNIHLSGWSVDISSLWKVKADKPTIETSGSTSYTFDFSNMYNSEMRLTSPSAISIKFVDTEYEYDYISGLSFNCGESPTQFDYSASGIINWVGTDCTKDGDLSIFQPSANTHYDIVFYFNGTQFIGLVNGFIPSSGNVVSE